MKHEHANIPATIVPAPHDTLAFPDVEATGVRRWLPGGPEAGVFHPCEAVAHFHFDSRGRHLLAIASVANYSKCQFVAYRWPDLERIHKSPSAGVGAAGRGLSNSAVNDFAATDRWALLGLADQVVRMIRIDEDGTPGADVDERELWRGIDRKPFVRTGNSISAVGLASDDSLAIWGDRQGHLFAKTLPDFREVDFGGGEHADGINAIAYDPGRRLLATGGFDSTLRIWRREGDRFLATLQLPLPGPIARIRFSLDGRRLAVLVRDERTVRVWNLERLRAKLANHELNW